ncbi:ATP-binding protein [Listeria kieliensis]
MGLRKQVEPVESPCGALFKNMILSPDGDVYAFYRLAKIDCPLNNESFFEDYVSDGKGLLGNINFDYKLFDVPQGYDVTKHIEKTVQNITTKDEVSNYYWRRSAAILQDEVQNHNYTQYLQVRLTKPNEILDPIDYFRELKEQTKSFLKKMVGNYETKQKPLSHYLELEKSLYNDLQNYKSLDRLSEEELSKIFYYNFHRANQTPLSQAQINPFNMMEGEVTNHKGYLTVEQIDKTHYISILPVIDTPNGLYCSGFVQQLRDTLPFPIETQMHVRFNSEKSDTRKIDKIRKRLYNQQKDRSQVDNPLDDDDAVDFGEDTLKELKEQLSQGEFQLAKITLFFVISSDSKEELESRIRSFNFAIERTKFKVYQPVVDQLVLFHQALPGTNYTFRLFEREVSTGYIAELGMDLEKNIGNQYGMPLGRLIVQKKFRDHEEARQNSSKVVYFNPSLTKKKGAGDGEATNGNTYISGPPGRGKSVAVKYMFCWLPSLGQVVLYVDPKDETEDFFMKAKDEYKHIPEFQAFVDRINFVRLSSDEKNRGFLDPLIFLEGETAEMAAKETLEELGEVNADARVASGKKVTIQRALSQVLQGNEPKNMSRVVEEIRKKDEELADLIGGHNKGIGKVLFGTDKSTRLDFSSPITVLGIAGLKLPTTEEVKNNRPLIPIQRVSQVIMENTYRLINIFSTDREQDAAIIFDETAGLEHTASGREKMEDSMRKGRANNTDVYLVGHAVTDLGDDPAKQQLISHKFIFKPTQDEEIDRQLDFLQLEKNKTNRDLIKSLKSGTCLFQDHMGRTQPIVIDVLFEEWLKACSSTDQTNELTRNALEMEKEKVI